MEVNQILYTKDGSKVGNAIILGQNVNGLFTIKTDYGNELDLSESAIRLYFHIGPINNGHKYTRKNNGINFNGFSPMKWRIKKHIYETK